MNTPTRTDEPIARNPKSWQVSARTLIHSANTLFRDFERLAGDREPDLPVTDGVQRHRLMPGDLHFYSMHSFTIIMMLYGLAIENLVKGLLIAHGIEQPFENGRLNQRITTHNLRLLCDRARLNYIRTNEDNQLLAVLSEVDESGKYPISTRFPDPLYTRHPYLQHNRPYEEMRQHALRILTMLERELRDATSNSTQGGVENELDLSTL